MQIGVTWCSFVKLDADWFNLVRFGALGATWCRLGKLGSV